MNTRKEKININFWNLIILESIKYINNKQLQALDKQQEIQELGLKVGEKSTNLLLSNIGGKIKMEEHDAIKFISHDVLNFIFKPASKTSSKSKNTYIYEMDEFPILYPFIIDKDVSMQNTEIIDLILNYYAGIIKGGLKVLNIESIVTGSFKYDVLYKNTSLQSKADQYPLRFTITILQKII
jgi:hypothetical protein